MTENKFTNKQKEFEDTKGGIQKDGQNGKKKKDERTNNDLQNITQKTKDPATRTTLKTGDEEEFEYTKGAIRIRISKKNRQHNGQKKKYKRTNNDIQSIHIQLNIE